MDFEVDPPLLVDKPFEFFLLPLFLGSFLTGHPNFSLLNTGRPTTDAMWLLLIKSSCG